MININNNEKKMVRNTNYLLNKFETCKLLLTNTNPYIYFNSQCQTYNVTPNNVQIQINNKNNTEQ